MGWATRTIAALWVPVCAAAVLVAAGCGQSTPPAPPVATGDATPAPAPAPANPETHADHAERGGHAAIVIDPALPVYEPVPGVSGVLRAAGSDTMLNLTTSWANAFAKAHPSVQQQVEGKGSGTAPTALEENQAEFGPMSRAMSPSELDRFESKFGYPPTELRVAIDCVAVFVHRDNPVGSLTLEQVRRIFSVAGGDLTWGDLGVTDPAWAGRSVSVYGRNSASGTYTFFKDAALQGTDFKPTVKEQPGSSGVIAAVANDPGSVGYSGVGYATPGVRAVALAYEDEAAVAPSVEAAMSGEYPLARFLYVYLNHDGATALDPLREGFVRFIFSRQGQEEVVKDGEYPVSAEVAREELTKLGLEAGF